MIFDTQCHYNLDPLFSEEGGWKLHWQKAQAHGVTKSVVVGTTVESSKVAIKIAEEDENLFASIGVHPNEADEEIDIDKLTSLLSHKKVVAVGETGLDYFRMSTESDSLEVKRKQQVALVIHTQLSTKKQLPLILHVRDQETEAYFDTLRILEEQKFDQPFILHCVSGPLAYVQKAVGMDAYIGLAGNVTYKNADRLREIAKVVPSNRLIVETDAPFLPPMPHRGKQCEPWMISLTVEYLESELHIDRQQLYQNAMEVFRLKS